MDLVTIAMQLLLALLGMNAGNGAGSAATRDIGAPGIEVARMIVNVVAGAGRFQCLPRLPDERQPEQLPCEDVGMARGSPPRR